MFLPMEILRFAESVVKQAAEENGLDYQPFLNPVLPVDTNLPEVLANSDAVFLVMWCIGPNLIWEKMDYRIDR